MQISSKLRHFGIGLIEDDQHAPLHSSCARSWTGSPRALADSFAAGPLIRFLEAASKPLGIEFSEDAWRSRVRTILEGALRQK
jgi:hypothetical protein